MNQSASRCRKVKRFVHHTSAQTTPWRYFSTLGFRLLEGKRKCLWRRRGKCGGCSLRLSICDATKRDFQGRLSAKSRIGFSTVFLDLNNLYQKKRRVKMTCLLRQFAIGSKSAIRTETLRTFTEDEYRRIIAALP